MGFKEGNLTVKKKETFMKHKYLWIVWFFIICFAMLPIIQIGQDFQLPFESAIIGLFCVLSAYLGFDFFASYTKTKLDGIKYEGSKKKLLVIVIVLLVIMVEYHVFQFATKMELPLGSLWLSVSGVSAILLGGKGLLNHAENLPVKKE